MFTLSALLFFNLLRHRKCHPVVWLRLRGRDSSCNRAAILRLTTRPAANHLQTRSLSPRQCNQTHGQCLYVFHLCQPAGEFSYIVSGCLSSLKVSRFTVITKIYSQRFFNQWINGKTLTKSSFSFRLSISLK